MDFPSGDHVTVFPVVGSGALVLSIAARNRLPEPSARAMESPVLSPTFPVYAIHLPSGDHSGFPEGSAAALRHTVLPSASVMIQSCPTGLRGPSLRVTV